MACLAFGFGAVPLAEALAATQTESATEFDRIRPEEAAGISWEIAMPCRDGGASMPSGATSVAFASAATAAFAMPAPPQLPTHPRPPSQAPPVV